MNGVSGQVGVVTDGYCHVGTEVRASPGLARRVCVWAACMRKTMHRRVNRPGDLHGVMATGAKVSGKAEVCGQ